MIVVVERLESAHVTDKDSALGIIAPHTWNVTSLNKPSSTLDLEQTPKRRTHLHLTHNPSWLDRITTATNSAPSFNMSLIDADAGTERFGGYEAELKLVQADLNQQLDEIPELTGEPRKAAISKAERALEEANELVSSTWYYRTSALQRAGNDSQPHTKKHHVSLEEEFANHPI